MTSIEGERQSIACPKCGFITERDFRFCQSCGAPLPHSEAYVEQGKHSRSEPKQPPSPLSVVSLVLGILGVFPAGALTGLLAVVSGAIVLRKRVPGMGLGLTGIVLGLLGTLITTPVFLVPFAFRTAEIRRQEQLKYAMHLLKESLDAWADSSGSFPAIEDDSDAATWIPVDIPSNPYTRSQYEYGKDIFYFPDGLSHPGSGRINRAADTRCPYNRLVAPELVPGTIVVLGYTDPETEEVSEYAITGFGRDVTTALWKMQALNGEAPEKTYIVLTGGLDTEHD